MDEDCALWGGVTESAACGDEFVWPTLIVSLLSSEADLAALRAAFDDLVLRGCGQDTEPDERPALAVCEDGVCGMGPEQAPPCGLAPSEDAGLPDAGEP